MCWQDFNGFSVIDSLLMIVVLLRLWCNTSWRLMVSVFSTPLYLVCKWAISKDQIICLWRLVSSVSCITITILIIALCLSIHMISKCYIQLQHVFICCLWHWNFQVCKIVEGQRYSKRLNDKQITALLKVTCQRPQAREKDILEVIVIIFLGVCF
jgi:hypothetical protein